MLLCNSLNIIVCLLNIMHNADILPVNQYPVHIMTKGIIFRLKFRDLRPDG